MADLHDDKRQRRLLQPLPPARQQRRQQLLVHPVAGRLVEDARVALPLQRSTAPLVPAAEARSQRCCLARATLSIGEDPGRDRCSASCSCSESLSSMQLGLSSSHTFMCFSLLAVSLQACSTHLVPHDAAQLQGARQGRDHLVEAVAALQGGQLGGGQRPRRHRHIRLQPVRDLRPTVGALQGGACEALILHPMTHDEQS